MRPLGIGPWESYTGPVIVFGIDPGLANVGLAVVEETGKKATALFHHCQTTRAQDPLPERLLQIYDATRDVIRCHRPDVVAMEEQYLKKQAGVAFSVGQAVGVIQLACAQAGLEVCLYGPMHVKQALVGTGRAEKDQVIYMVKASLGLRVLSNNHAADALALALTHLASHRLKGLTQRSP